MDERTRLAQTLLTYSVKTGDFTLASGAKSKHYVDVRRTALTGVGARLIGELLFESIHETAPDVVGCGGLTLGADPIVTAITVAAERHEQPFGGVLVRKHAKGHGTENWLEIAGNLHVPGPIVAVDDVITTAGSTIQAIERMRNHGFTINHAFCVVDREAGGAEALAGVNVQLHALFSLSELTA